MEETLPVAVDHSTTRTLAPDSDPLDLMYRVVGMYRLLDLISETGSGGAGSWILGALPICPGTNGLPSVDKIVIDQPSIEALANKLSPGSYTSMTKVNTPSIAHRKYQLTVLIITAQIDFQALAQQIIKPVGIYGSVSAIVKFFEDIGCIDAQT